MGGDCSQERVAQRAESEGKCLSGEDEIEQAPELAEAVLDGRAAHDEPVHGGELLAGDGDLRVGIADLVPLIEHLKVNEGPAERMSIIERIE